MREFDEFIRRMGESWLYATLTRLSSLIDDKADIGQVITVITVDFDLELDFRQHIIDTGTRTVVYDGLTKLLYNENNFTELRSNTLLHVEKGVY